MQTLEKIPTLTASRLHAMVRERGYQGAPAADGLRDGAVVLARDLPALLLDARMENFLRGHVGACETWDALPRVLLYDNLKSAVLERQGDAIRFHPALLALAAHYRFEPRPVAVARGKEKGRVERAIRYVRDAFFAARAFSDLADLNAQAAHWCHAQAANRPWPEDTGMRVRDALASEQPRLLRLPATPYATEEVVAVKAGKTPYVRVDLNDYSIPHTRVRRTLTVRASPELVRVFDGVAVIASHARSYDGKVQVELPEHIEALVAVKREARQHRGVNSLTRAVPACRDLLVQAAERGTNIGSLSAALLRLLDRYGAALHAAVHRRWPGCCRSMCGARTRRCGRTGLTATIN
ncbi:IS21 family transposase [Massilia sp. CCM 9210]|uniref:Mu transposase domain-containing protein n=1 Tax=Massilia scottii TaxID=3057166 RepID=UPI0027965090|nr:IS21 family transposase [Massilia sp. CCM 9210]MDQ1815090.1 IS21 family transposase [Massilia sp. CCM 9210]